ncbi:MAG TPA: hypothetical protein PLV58_00290 [Campylobacterales bacterium]|nr:hypothetical protein [Campylobacterales bacterium]
MLKKTLLAVFCLGSVCFADNFMIGGSLSGAPKVDKHESFGDHEKSDRLPQRAVIEDINPSSDLGQLVTVMLKNEQKKAAEATKKATVKKVVKKKVIKKKPADQNQTAAKDPYMEIKAEDPSKINEQDKKAAEHNENNSSLKKITTSSKVTH